MLVHMISDRDRADPAASFSYVFPRSRQCTDLSPMPPQSNQPQFVPGQNTVKACYSSAPLTGVCRVCIYRDRSSGSFQGLIFDYASGAQRALGSCRVGIDPVEWCEALADVRFRPTEASNGTGATIPFVSIEICVASETEEEEVDWTRLEEGGTLEMWFNHQAMTLYMIPAAL